MNITPAANKPITILLAEDNPADAELARFALEDTGIKHVLNVVEDGEEAIAYLTNNGKYLNAITPDLILLDLNMPRISGKEVLKMIKSNNSLQNIPVIILTSSEAKIDIRDAYKLEADYYLTKPINVDKISSVLGLKP